MTTSPPRPPMPPRPPSLPTSQPPSLSTYVQHLIDRARDTGQWSQVASYYQRCVDESQLARFAASLGVTVESLRRLSIGYDATENTWMFPERNGDGEVVGISRRHAVSSAKWMIEGGHRGLAMESSLGNYAGTSVTDPILLVEGATDAAAGLDLGFTTIGRPSNKGGVEHLRSLLRGLHVVIIGENDPAGQMGAEYTAAALYDITASLKIIYPPSGVKDLRQWKRRTPN